MLNMYKKCVIIAPGDIMLKKFHIKDFNYKNEKILEQLNKSSRALAELKGYAKSLPNADILLNVITINEAKDSSEIENIVTTHDKIYKALTQNDYKEESAKEVVDYRNAIYKGFELVKKNNYINTNTLVQIQETLEHNNAGIRKTLGTSLINSKTQEIIYTPPQTETEIRDYLKNLEEFINNFDDGIDPLIKLALIHYQFELIHPFYDANGRTGRILNVLYLVLTNLLDSPILYLSRFINKTKQEYYKQFDITRKSGNYDDFIIYMLKGIEITSLETLHFIMTIQSEMEDFKQEFKDKLPKIYSDKLLNNLFYGVYTRISYVEKDCGVTRLTAMSYLKQLEKVGLLESEKIGRERVYKNIRLIKVLKNMDLEDKLLSYMVSLGE